MQSLHHYLNYRFTFKTDQYNGAMAKLSDTDREIFYDQSKVDTNA